MKHSSNKNFFFLFSFILLRSPSLFPYSAFTFKKTKKKIEEEGKIISTATTLIFSKCTANFFWECFNTSHSLPLASLSSCKLLLKWFIIFYYSFFCFHSLTFIFQLVSTQNSPSISFAHLISPLLIVYTLSSTSIRSIPFIPFVSFFILSFFCCIFFYFILFCIICFTSSRIWKFIHIIFKFSSVCDFE